MSIKLFKDTRSIPLKTRKYSAGEVYIAIDDDSSNISQQCIIQANIQSSDDIMSLLMLTDAIKTKWGTIEVILEMPYVPYGRHDRVMLDGEPLALKVFCGLINSQSYHEVIIYDPHSDVTPALLNNVRVLPQEFFIEELPITGHNCTLVAPDAGASKKAYEVARQCGFDQVLQAGKVRNLSTGQISETTLYDAPIMVNTDFLIVDDICDGGRTFIELAKKLREISTGSIYLYVTHGIFSKGLTELKLYIDHIYVVNNFTRANRDDTFLTVINRKTNKRTER